MPETSKGSECPICGGNEWIISEDKEGRIQAKPCKCQEYNRMSRRLRFAEIPDSFKNNQMENFKLGVYKTIEGRNTASRACKQIKTYMDEFDTAKINGLGLYLFSRTKGSGKTRMAASIANKLVQSYPVKFAVSGEILNEIKRTYDKASEVSESKLLDDLVDTEILFIDDFGMDTASPWVNDKFYHIINERYINKKVTFFTSNLPVEQLKYDDRISNRVQGMTYQIPFPEESVRRQEALDRNQQLMKQSSGGAK